MRFNRDMSGRNSVNVSRKKSQNATPDYDSTRDDGGRLTATLQTAGFFCVAAMEANGDGCW